MRTRTALVIAPHPDDEVLGAGATIARLAAEGWAVDVSVVCADLPPLYDADVSRTVEREARDAHALLGVRRSVFHGFPSVEVSRSPLAELTGAVRSAVEASEPSLVLIPFPDRHADHRAVFDAAMVATRPIGVGRQIRTLAMYETVSETFWNAPGAEPSFVPTMHVDISDHLETKLQAMQCYASQLQPDPGPRSLRALRSLAGFRGSQVSMRSAEAFQTVRVSVPRGDVLA